ncbi:MAG: polysaccharide deacetylase [Halomonadaceae bacterium]|nr:MAG: polysaccharide deacetylase [Halomonadaceae bacterium]
MSRVSGFYRWAGPRGLFQLARLLNRKQPRILMYHRFSDQAREGFTSAAAFHAQVRHIKRHYHPLTTAQLVRSLFENEPLPSNAVVITVDDGYQDFHRVAFPVLQALQVPATLYVTTGFVDGRLWLWPDQLQWLLAQADPVGQGFRLGPVTVPAGLHNAVLQGRLAKALVTHCLSLDNTEKNALIGQLADQLGVTLPKSAPAGYEAVNWQQLSELHKAGIEVGGHTQTHPSLGRVPLQQAQEEIAGCYDALVRHLGPAERTFCYPNGQPTDFSPALKPMVKEAGFSGAVLAFPDAVGLRDRYALRRHGSGEGAFQFHKAISGLEFLGKRLRRSPKNVAISQG